MMALGPLKSDNDTIVIALRKYVAGAAQARITGFLLWIP